MKKINIKTKRKLRNRKKLQAVNNNRFRISVFKSLNNLSAQIIDDKIRKTLVSASSIEKEIKGKKIKKMEKSIILGEIVAKRAKEKNISEAEVSDKGFQAVPNEFIRRFTSRNLQIVFSYL